MDHMETLNRLARELATGESRQAVEFAIMEIPRVRQQVTVKEILARDQTRMIGDYVDRVTRLETENTKLRSALSICRGQWIHSVHAAQCCEALGEEQPRVNE